MNQEDVQFRGTLPNNKKAHLFSWHARQEMTGEKKEDKNISLL